MGGGTIYDVAGTNTINLPADRSQSAPLQKNASINDIKAYKELTTKPYLISKNSIKNFLNVYLNHIGVYFPEPIGRKSLLGIRKHSEDIYRTSHNLTSWPHIEYIKQTSSTCKHPNKVSDQYRTTTIINKNAYLPKNHLYITRPDKRRVLIKYPYSF